MAKDEIKGEIRAVEGLEFLLCGFGKLLTWAATGRNMYAIKYWAVLDANGCDQWDSNDDSEM